MEAPEQRSKTTAAYQAHPALVRLEELATFRGGLPSAPGSTAHH
jgi:hypothetical protein